MCRCLGEDDTTQITSPSNAIHGFTWQMLAFRYFGNSDGVIITCEVLVCKNEPCGSLSDKCKRCGQAYNRRGRKVDTDDTVLIKTIMTSQPIYIIENEGWIIFISRINTNKKKPPNLGMVRLSCTFDISEMYSSMEGATLYIQMCRRR